MSSDQSILRRSGDSYRTGQSDPRSVWRVRLGGAQGHSEATSAVVADPRGHRERSADARARGLAGLLDQFRELDQRVQPYDVKLRELAQQSEPARRLMRVESIGPMTAPAIVASMGDPYVFRSGRNYAASLGLTPRQHRTADRLARSIARSTPSATTDRSTHVTYSRSMTTFGFISLFMPPAVTPPDDVGDEHLKDRAGQVRIPVAVTSRNNMGRSSAAYHALDQAMAEALHNGDVAATKRCARNRMRFARSARHSCMPSAKRMLRARSLCIRRWWPMA